MQSQKDLLLPDFLRSLSAGPDNSNRGSQSGLWLNIKESAKYNGAFFDAFQPDPPLLKVHCLHFGQIKPLTIVFDNQLNFIFYMTQRNPNFIGLAVFGDVIQGLLQNSLDEDI